MLGELSAEQIETLLHQEAVGRIGCHAKGVTYVVPIVYAYEAGSIYAHSRDGLKLRMMRENPNVCFEVDHVDSLTNWKSVIASGKFEEIGWESAQSALQLLVQRFSRVSSGELAPGHPFQPSIHSGDSPVRVFRIRLTEKTGRFESSRPGNTPRESDVAIGH